MKINNNMVEHDVKRDIFKRILYEKLNKYNLSATREHKYCSDWNIKSNVWSDFWSYFQSYPVTIRESGIVWIRDRRYKDFVLDFVQEIEKIVKYEWTIHNDIGDRKEL